MPCFTKSEDAGGELRVACRTEKLLQVDNGSVAIVCLLDSEHGDSRLVKREQAAETGKAGEEMSRMKEKRAPGWRARIGKKGSSAKSKIND